MPYPRPAVGQLIRDRRGQLSMSLQRLSELVGCAKSYLSQIENGRRPNPPGDELLGRLEAALHLQGGTLIEAARWQSTPESVQREVESLETKQRAARRLAELVAGRSLADGGTLKRGRLDAAFRSGELHRLVETLAPTTARAGAGPPREVPLINSVAAGYPIEFTDLGYPVRIADEYVRVPDLDDPDAFAARVIGDSMEPEYREGDVVVFSPMREVRSGQDCFVRLEHDAHTTFKRVYFEVGGNGEERIRLQPLNSAYAPQVYRREQVAGLYAAVSVTRRIM
ncbi:MAG: LexA family transcriptional regulator [Planctomycetes bacterium]|nr:LexA family transcriptional regulator [Planctomycetota bacterium]